MRSLLVVAAALSAALYPFSSPRAEQAAPVPVAPAASASAGGLTEITILDQGGTLRTMLCQPSGVETAAPRRVVSTPLTRALPASPVQASAPAAASPQPPARAQPCLPPPRPTDLNVMPYAPLYADPAAVEAAWNCYAPRRMAYAPRARSVPDPAVHSPLPSPRSTVRRSARPSAPPKTPAPLGIDVLVSTVQALCPPSASPAASAAGGVPPANPPVPQVNPATAPTPAGAPAAATRDVYEGTAPSVRNTPTDR